MFRILKNETELKELSLKQRNMLIAYWGEPAPVIVTAETVVISGSPVRTCVIRPRPGYNG